MWKSAVAVAALMACANSSLAWVNLEANCAGGQAQIALRIGNTYGPEFVGLVVTRYQLGTCETPVIVTESPVPLPIESSSPNLSVPAPIANVFYLFEAKLVDDAGNLHSIEEDMVMGRLEVPHDFASEGAAVAMRGTLSWGGAPGSYVYITPCQDGCWGDPTEPVLVAPLYGFPYPLVVYSLIHYGLVSDIVGRPREPDGMLQPEGNYIVENLQPAPAGSCGVVAEDLWSWGSTKALFR